MVLQLNPNIMFHDGTPCDAEAVRFNLDRCMNYKLSAVKPDLASIASMEVADPLKLVLHLKYPDTALPLTLSERTGMVGSPTAIKAAGEDYDRKPCGTGQFKFVSWADGDRIIVTRNEITGRRTDRISTASRSHHRRLAAGAVRSRPAMT